MFIDFWISDQDIEQAAIMQGTNRTAVVNELREVAEEQARRKLSALSVPQMTRADDIPADVGVKPPLTYAEALALMGVTEEEFNAVVGEEPGLELPLTEIGKPQDRSTEVKLAGLAARVLSQTSFEDAAHAAQQEEDRPKFEVLRCGHTVSEACTCTFAEAMFYRTCTRCDNRQHIDVVCPHCPLGCDDFGVCNHGSASYSEADVKE